jgi:subtilisin family serine protease
VTNPDAPRPAHARESTVLRLPGAVSLDDLSPEWAWGGATGNGVRVAVVDSGIDADHPALEGCVDREGGIMVTLDDAGEPVVTPGPHDDAFGHGTACAGIIHSFAPEARLTSVRVLGAGLTGKAAAFLHGLAWAIDQGFDVINLSLGTTKRDWALAFHDVCDRAYFSNSFLVTAANNVNRASFPSLYSSVTSVACNMATDPWRFHFNPDPPTEFLARGIDVELPWLNRTTIRTTGNSFAAPHITGIATLIRSKHPELRPFQVKTVLWATAANVREAPVAAGRLSRVMRPPTASVRASTILRRPG